VEPILLLLQRLVRLLARDRTGLGVLDRGGDFLCILEREQNTFITTKITVSNTTAAASTSSELLVPSIDKWIKRDASFRQ